MARNTAARLLRICLWLFAAALKVAKGMCCGKLVWLTLRCWLAAQERGPERIKRDLDSISRLSFSVDKKFSEGATSQVKRRSSGFLDEKMA
jgi:hypothetical protein